MDGLRVEFDEEGRVYSVKMKFEDRQREFRPTDLSGFIRGFKPSLKRMHFYGEALREKESALRSCLEGVGSLSKERGNYTPLQKSLRIAEEAATDSIESGNYKDAVYNYLTDLRKFLTEADSLVGYMRIALDHEYSKKGDDRILYFIDEENKDVLALTESYIEEIKLRAKRASKGAEESPYI